VSRNTAGSPAETREIAQAFAALSEEAVAARFDPARMTELRIYAAAWDRPETLEREREWALEAVREVRAVVNEAARRGHGLLILIA
jgi:hypothetical protein